MPTQSTLTGPERGLVDALHALGEQTRAVPRAGFSAALRERLVAEAAAIEAEEADAFQRALDGGEVAPELASLAAFATALAAVESQGAPASMRNGRRDRVLSTVTSDNVVPIAEATIRRSAQGLSRRLSRRLVVAAALSGMLVSSASFAFAASADDTPADALYGIKRFRERTQTWFISGADEGLRRLRFADSRVDETETMLERGITEAAPFERAFRDLESELALASGLILEAQARGDETGAAALPELANFLAVNHPRVRGLADDVPEPARAAAADAIETLEEAADLTEPEVDGCVLCGDEPVIPSGSTKPDDREPCSSCSPDWRGEDDGLLPGGSDGDDTDRGGPIGGREDDDDEPRPRPTPPPVLEPLPDPDRIPDLPGRIDDDLEQPAGQLTGGLLG